MVSYESKSPLKPKMGKPSAADDFLGGDLGEWQEIPATLEEQPFFNMPEATMVTGIGASLDFVKGATQVNLFCTIQITKSIMR